MLKISFDIDVWSFSVIFYGDVSEADNDTGLQLGGISTFTYDDISTVIIVVDGCGAGIPSLENLKYIVHESNHAAMRVLERVGVPVDFNNQEALCYTQDFIFSKILKGLVHA